MPKNKVERIASIEEQIAQLETQRKSLIQKQKEEERKTRTKRLMERGAILESLIPSTDALTNEQVKTFLEKTVQTEFAQKILSGLKPQNGGAEMVKPAESAQDNVAVMPPNSDHSTQQVS